MNCQLINYLCNSIKSSFFISALAVLSLIPIGCQSPQTESSPSQKEKVSIPANPDVDLEISNESVQMPTQTIILVSGSITNIENAETRKSINNNGIVENTTVPVDTVYKETLNPKFENTTLTLNPDGSVLLTLNDFNTIDGSTYPWRGTWQKVENIIKFSCGFVGIDPVTRAENNSQVQGEIQQVNGSNYVLRINYQRTHVFAVATDFVSGGGSWYTTATFTQNWQKIER